MEFLQQYLTLIANVYAVILAGGRGSRLPIAGSIGKQFAQKFNGITFIQDIVRMITQAINPSHIIVVVTDDQQMELAKEQLAQYRVPDANIIKFDPHLGYVAVMAAAADYIRSQIDPKAVAFFSPSDQHIVEQEAFTNAIIAACNEAMQRPVLIGAKVHDANIVGGCGNAMYDATEVGDFYEIKDFIEKPLRDGMERVEQILRDDNTAVNTGFYAVRADQFCAKYPIHKIEAMLERHYEQHSEAVDLGLDPTEMVKELGMRLMVADFKWKDCGTLIEYYHIQPKTPNHLNASIGEVDRHDCRSGLFVSSTKGVRLHVNCIKRLVAVLTCIRENDKLNVAVINMALSQKVGQVTNFLENGSAMSYFLLSRNCTIMPSNLDMRAAFLGMQNVTVRAYRANDGNTDVYVSADGECVYEEA